MSLVNYSIVLGWFWKTYIILRCSDWMSLNFLQIRAIIFLLPKFSKKVDTNEILFDLSLNGDGSCKGAFIITFSQNDQNLDCLPPPSPFLTLAQFWYPPSCERSKLYINSSHHHHYQPLTKTIAKLCYFLDS